MRINELLVEYDYDHHSKIVNQAMSKAGYRKKGEGADAVVYSRDAGTVIKIIMPIIGDYGLADQTFLTWYNFCQQHAGNPHLPKFQKIAGQHHAQFEIDGEKFRQIAMEKLKPIPAGSKLDDVVLDLVKSVEHNKSVKDIEMANLKYIYRGKPIPSQVLRHTEQHIKLIEKIMNQYPELYKTLTAVFQTGRRAGLSSDMATRNNVMMRADGTPVITDPWSD